MNTIEKTNADGNIQYFEIIKSREELRSWFNMFDFFNEKGIWYDDDTSIAFEMKDGNYICFSYGDKKQRINFSKVRSMLYSGTASTTLYGNVEIKYNSH